MNENTDASAIITPKEAFRTIVKNNLSLFIQHHKFFTLNERMTQQQNNYYRFVICRRVTKKDQRPDYATTF